MTDRTEHLPPTRRRPRRATILCATAILVALAANACVPCLFAALGGDVADYSAIAAGGALVGEACLLAIWAALGSQRWLTRLPITWALLILGSCAYSLGLQILEQSLQIEVVVIIMIAACLVFLSVQLPLVIVRAVTKQRVDWPDTARQAVRVESAQFGLPYLLGWTAGVAFLLAVVRHTLPDDQFTRAMFGNMGEILILMASLATLSALICLPCVSLTLGSRRTPYLVWLLSVLLLGPTVAVLFISSILGSPPDFGEIVLAIHGFTLGLVSAILAVLLPVRLIGLRLVLPPTASGER